MLTCFDSCGGECCQDIVLTMRERDIIVEGCRERGVDPVAWTGLIKRCVQRDDGFLVLRGPCPLLDKKKRCLAYEERPLNCANYHCGRRVSAERLEYDDKRHCLNHARRVRSDLKYKTAFLVNVEANRWRAERGGWV